MALRFDARAHSYFDGGRSFRSVTGVLKAAGLIDGSAFFTEESRARGRAVHALTAALDLGLWEGPGNAFPWPPHVTPPPPEIVAHARREGQGGAFWCACPPELEGYLRAYVRWRGLYAPRWARVEVPLARADLRLAGTPDRVGAVAGVAVDVELKTGAEADWHALQLAGYDLLDPLPFERQRWALYLRPDGRFKYRPCRDPGDRARFLALAAAV